ncbi:MAG TPA: SMI1/KNR4 family protein [Ktedonobacteraceae bacterium]|jgi:hypothetical protein|nr:SMI1/KNR4 family protein [Ktedonobacteraceae bacterium]
MTQKPASGLKALAALQSRLDAESYVEVIHENGHCWRAYCKLNAPAVPEAIEAVKQQLSMPLPFTYEQFLLHYNGALLYYDNEYGQWGFELYGTENLLIANVNAQKRYEDEWALSYLVFAESYGDADLLIIDTAQMVNEGKDCRVIDGDSGYALQQWRVAARSFSDWIDRLVVAQGAKYWRWR